MSTSDYPGADGDFAVEGRPTHTIAEQSVAQIAHDLHNLLTVVRHRLEAALSVVPADLHAHQELDAAYRALHECTTSVHRLISPATFERVRESVDIFELVEATIHLIKPLIPERIALTIDNTCSDEGGAPKVVGDRQLLQNALINLIKNGREAISGTGKICIRLSQEPAWAVVTVEDTGAGIANAALPRIFEGDFTTKQDGHGLGLRNVAHCIRTHGGSIDVTSTPGQGTAITMRLPVVYAAHTAVQTTQSAPTALRPTADGALVAPSNRSLSILVADDDDAVRATLHSTVARLGCRVASVASGAEVLSEVQRSPNSYDLILIDDQMPGGRGADLLVTLSKLTPHTLLVLTSGDPNAAPKTDDIVFLPKPFGIDDLERIILRTAVKGTS
jgi:CheY-like chemotaxis protein